jgi:transcriptional regulator GlxA family with amidase domain
MVKSVAALVHDKIGALSLGVVTEFFGYDRTGQGLPRFDFALAAERTGIVRTEFGVTLQIEHGLERLRTADIVLAMPVDDHAFEASEPVLAELRAAHERGATLLGFCSGTYLLAAAGLLDGRRATTHWQWVDQIAGRFPEVSLDPDVLYVDEGRVLTGAGGAAGIDLCLYYLRREYGAKVANSVARGLVVPPHRDGGQAQYIVSPLPVVGDSDRLGDVLAWMRENLHEQVTVDDLAARALMSPRSFARHFRTVTGTTPRAWLLAQRMHRAEELLESGDLPVEEIARQAGFGTAAALREQFVRRRGVPPRSYRRSFRAATPA